MDFADWFAPPQDLAVTWNKVSDKLSEFLSHNVKNKAVLAPLSQLCDKPAISIGKESIRYLTNRIKQL